MSGTWLIQVGSRGLVLAIPQHGPVTLLAGFSVVEELIIDPAVKVELTDEAAQTLKLQLTKLLKREISAVEISGQQGRIRVFVGSGKSPYNFTITGERIPTRIAHTFDVSNVSAGAIRERLIDPLSTELPLRQGRWYRVTWLSQEHRNEVAKHTHRFRTPRVYLEFIPYGELEAFILTRLREPEAWLARLYRNNLPVDMQEPPIWKAWSDQLPPEVASVVNKE